MRHFVILGSLLFAAVVIPIAGILSTATESAPPPAPNTVTMTFLGDLMAHDVNFKRPPFDRIYAGIRPWITTDDLTFANLEYPMSPSKPESSWPLFNAPRDYTEAAVEAGINVFSLANNHSTDQGARGIRETLEILREIKNRNPVYFSGIRNYGSDFPVPEAIPLQGKTIGFLSVTGLLNQPDEENQVLSLPFVSRTRSQKAAHQALADYIRTLRPLYDFFILAYHGGFEYNHTPPQAKQDFFRLLVRSGVDVVWGHHPHVLQPWEIYETPDRSGLILYSCGNLISGQSWFVDPEEEDPPRASTGETALYSAIYDWDQTPPRLELMTPVPLVNYRKPAPGSTMEIRPVNPLIREGKLPEDWGAYFRKRNPTHTKKIQPLRTPRNETTSR